MQGEPDWIFVAIMCFWMTRVRLEHIKSIRISIDDIKGKYFESEKLELRNKFIKEVRNNG